MTKQEAIEILTPDTIVDANALRRLGFDKAFRKLKATEMAIDALNAWEERNG